MFDKLIESEPESADFHNRRRYFMVSSVVVGALFLTAVVISIYASDYGLGSNSFELSMMLAPVEMAAVEPEPARPQPPSASSQSRDLPTRPEIISRTDESRYVPTSTSSDRNPYWSRPEGLVRLGDENNVDNSYGNGRETGGSGSGGGGIASTTQVDEGPSVAEPPPIKKEALKKQVIRSLGPVNGKATYLPKPAYSAAAIAMHIDGKVDVQVTIDESGRVISATAVSGHILLRSAAEQAARSAKFSPTFLSNVPVKVTGVITYNFVR